MKFLYRHRVLFGAAAVACSVLLTLGVCLYALNETAAGYFELTVVIDAGHGGIDGGVVGRLTGQKESDINLAVSRRLQTELENAGLRVVQTRPTEAGLYGVSTSGYKKRDMQKRAQIIRDSVPSAVISVHQNFFSLSSRRGAQVFYRAGSEASYLLACAVQTELNGMEECVRSVQPLTGDYYILNCSEFPSVIVECGFLSNAQDEALLTDGDYQTKLAQTICRGALTFLAAGADAGR